MCYGKMVGCGGWGLLTFLSSLRNLLKIIRKATQEWDLYGAWSKHLAWLKPCWLGVLNFGIWPIMMATVVDESWMTRTCANHVMSPQVQFEKSKQDRSCICWRKCSIWFLDFKLVYILGFSRYDLSRYHCLRLDNFLDQSLPTAMPTTSHNNHRRCYHCQVVVETRCCNAAQSWSPMVSGPPSNPASLGSLRAVATWWPMVSFNLLGSNQNQTSIVEEIANWNIRLFCLEFFPTNVF